MNITNDKVTEYIYSHYTPITEGLGQLRAYAEDMKVPIILRDTETLMMNIVRILSPKQILEIGTAIGYSAACFAIAAQDAQVTTIERDEKTYEKALDNICELDLAGRVHCLNGDAIEILLELSTKMHAERLEPYDLVFIDAGKSHYRDFFQHAVKMTKPGSVIICDNVLLKAATVSDEYDIGGRHKTNVRKMREFVNYLMSLENAETSLISVGDGLTVSIIK